MFGRPDGQIWPIAGRPDPTGSYRLTTRTRWIDRTTWSCHRGDRTVATAPLPDGRLRRARWPRGPSCPSATTPTGRDTLVRVVELSDARTVFGSTRGVSHRGAATLPRFPARTCPRVRPCIPYVAFCRQGLEIALESASWRTRSMSTRATCVDEYLYSSRSNWGAARI